MTTAPTDPITGRATTPNENEIANTATRTEAAPHPRPPPLPCALHGANVMEELSGYDEDAAESRPSASRTIFVAPTARKNARPALELDVGLADAARRRELPRRLRAWRRPRRAATRAPRRRPPRRRGPRAAGARRAHAGASSHAVCAPRIPLLGARRLRMTRTVFFASDAVRPMPAFACTSG